MLADIDKRKCGCYVTDKADRSNDTMNIQEFIKKQPPGRLITMGFALVILIGTLLLLLPFSIKSGVTVTPLNALFTATSAVCVTGLVVVDTADTFTAFGQTVIGILIQIGGLGVASARLGLMIAAGKKVSIKSRVLAKEALNVDSYKGIVRMVEAVLLITLVVETAGALLSFPVFLKDYSPLHALGISIFHSVASFNNAGFDILGNMTNLIPYRDNVALNIITSVLVIVGGIGFPVILDLGRQRNFRRLTLHTKVVLVTTGILLAGGTLFLKLTEPISWMAAFFHSMSARTAGFSTCSLGSFSNGGLFVICILMFIGASSGSTGGGVKTSTMFVLLQSVRSEFSKRPVGAFRRSIPKENVSRASMIVICSALMVCVGTFLMCVAEPELTFMQLFFETVSAFSTAGLSTGITPGLGIAARWILIFFMFTGRLGAMTMITIWVSRQPKNARYTEESVTIG